MNWEIEEDGSKEDAKDFFNIFKVDNHIHLAAAMTSPHLLEFIQHKAKTCPDDVVAKDATTGEPQTLAHVFAKAEISAEGITTESLETSGSRKMFKRFDYFNASYSPFGKADLRTIFLKSDNLQKGKYFAELAKEVYARAEAQAHNVLYVVRWLALFFFSFENRIPRNLRKFFSCLLTMFRICIPSTCMGPIVLAF